MQRAVGQVPGQQKTSTEKPAKEQKSAPLVESKASAPTEPLGVTLRPRGEIKKPDVLTYARKPLSVITTTTTTTSFMTLLDKPASIPPPSTLGKAKLSAWWGGYEKAIHEEIDNLEKLECWEYVSWKDIPKGANILRSKLVFDDKREADGKLIKFKARMVAMGYTQIFGIDYVDTFASVVVSKSFRILLAIWNLDPNFSFLHWDVKQAFINAPIEETIYVYPVKGFEKPGKEGEILKLKKALYGTKQAANAWQKFLKSIIFETGAVQHPKDECVFILKEKESWCFLCTHVDDIFVLHNGSGVSLKGKVFQHLSAKVTVDNRGEVKWALSTRIQRDAKRGIVKISQEDDVNSLLEKYDPDSCKTEDTPMCESGINAIMSEADLTPPSQELAEVANFPFRNIIGKLWWLVMVSRPDINYAVHRCACYVNNPSKKLRSWLVRIMRYLRHTKAIGLVYDRNMYNPKEILVGYSDASFCSEERSLSRHGTLFFVAGALVHWSSSKTSRVVSSTTEAEVHGLIQLGKENIWQREFHHILGFFKIDKPTTTALDKLHQSLVKDDRKIVLAGSGPSIGYQDNQSAISLAKGGPKHKRSKHFGLEFDMFREYIARGELEIRYMHTDELIADTLTKPLGSAKFLGFRDAMMGNAGVQKHFS
jgi:hypothetical protein